MLLIGANPLKLEDAVTTLFEPDKKTDCEVQFKYIPELVDTPISKIFGNADVVIYELGTILGNINGAVTV